MSEILLLTLWKLSTKLLIIAFFWEKLPLGEGSLYTAVFVFIFLGAWLWHQHFKIVRHDITCLCWATVQQMSV